MNDTCVGLVLHVPTGPGYRLTERVVIEVPTKTILQSDSLRFHHNEHRVVSIGGPESFQSHWWKCHMIFLREEDRLLYSILSTSSPENPV